VKKAGLREKQVDSELRRKIASAPELRPDPSRINRTEAALVSRGIDLSLARKLRKRGLTLSQLQQMSLKRLRALKLGNDAIRNLHGTGRPSIPFEALIRVLIANRFTCCVCHDSEKSVIVHHVVEWASSRDHRSNNLAVLCLACHDSAHTTKQLTQNLDAKKLIRFKAQWEALVAATNTTAVLDASRHNYDAWWYFNHFRIFQIANSMRLDLTQLAGYEDAFSEGLITKNGMLRPRSGNQWYMYDDGNGMTLYSYVREVLHSVLERLTVFNASDDMDRIVLAAILRSGDFVYIQGLHRFKKTVEKDRGRGQLRTGRRKAHSVMFSYVFDGWEAVSTSAWAVWLKGSQVAGSVIRVTGLSRPKGILQIKGTVLGICHALPNQKTRRYSPALYQSGVMLVGEDE